MNPNIIDAFALLTSSLNTLEIVNVPNPDIKQSNDIPESSRIVNKVYDYIKQRLKEQYTKSCYSKQLRGLLRETILAGELHELNYSWVCIISNRPYLNSLVQGLARCKIPESTISYVNQKRLIQNHSLRQSQRQFVHGRLVKDVPRTQAQSKSQEQKICNILSAYAVRNPFVGYCQGLNFIAHFLVNVLKYSEEDSFWILSSLMESIMPLDYYTNMISVCVDIKILEYLSKIYVPKLNAHFKEIELDGNFYGVQLLVCIFTQNVSIELAKEIWLRLVVQGSMVLILSVISIQYLIQDLLLKHFDFSEVVEVLRQQLKSFNRIQEFRQVCNQLSICNLNSVRDILRREYQEQQEGTQFQEVTRVQCNKDWTICNQVIQLNRTLRRSFSFFVYSQKQPCQIINDYWDRVSEAKETNELIVGRQFHICDQEEIHQDTLYRSTLFVELPQDEIRPRSKAIQISMPKLNEQGYDKFYQQARLLIDKNRSLEVQKSKLMEKRGSLGVYYYF